VGSAVHSLASSPRRSEPPVADADADVVVAILGPVEVRGAAGPFARAFALDLVVYLSVHDRGVANEAWATALWPDRAMAPATLHSTASVARRSLGRSASGHDHLPRCRGRLSLARSVTTDWRRLQRDARRDDPDSWWRGLEAVRGRPFDGLRSADWVVLEGIGAAVEEDVVRLAIKVAEHHLGRGEGARAARAARLGLLSSPFDERLYRLLLRAADAEGNPSGVESAMAELVVVAGGAPAGAGVPRHLAAAHMAVVHPETAHLYRSLSRRGGAAGGAPARL